MAKSYSKGLEYRLYLNTGTYALPTWVEVPQASEIGVNPNKADVEVPERGADTGHLHGKGNGMFSLTLMEDKGSTSVDTLVAALMDDSTPVHLAVSRGDLAVSGTVYYHAECCLLSGELSTDQDGVSAYDIEAYRHANSDNGFLKATAA